MPSKTHALLARTAAIRGRAAGAAVSERGAMMRYVGVNILRYTPDLQNTIALHGIYI